MPVTREEVASFQEYERATQQVRRAVEQVYMLAGRNVVAWQELSAALAPGGRFAEFAAMHAEGTAGLKPEHYAALFQAVAILQQAIEAMDDAHPGLFNLRRERQGGEMVALGGPGRAQRGLRPLR